MQVALISIIIGLKKYIDYPLLSRVLALAKPYKGLFLFAAMLAILKAPLAIIRPYIVKSVINVNLPAKDYKGLVTMIIIMVAVLLFNAILNYSFIISTNKLGQQVIRDLRIRVYEHLLKLKLSYFDKTPIGTSTTRAVNDIETINSVFSQGIITIIADLLTLITVIVTMFIMSWRLTLVCLITVPLLLIATYIFKEKVKAAYQVVRTKISEMNAYLQERISGMHIVQIFNAEQTELDKFETINESYKKANIQTINYYAIFFPTVELLSATSLGLLAWFGGASAAKGVVDAGTFIAFPLLFGMMFRPIRMLADKFNVLQMGMVAAERVFNLLDDKNFIKDTGSDIMSSVHGKLKFEDVYFSYDQSTDNPDKEDLILKGVNFEVQPNETLAIVGSTGSGKTTIINVLNRFYETCGGKVTVDDIDIKTVTLESLRNQMAMVLQDVFLFSGSVLENITLRDKSITKEQVVASAKMIGAHEFIDKLPGAYDYQVMERGASLSLGQRQLISFVRALVCDPKILILDEATSSVDPETESVIQYAIEQLISKRTSIIIAHRLSTIRHADKILVLNKGEVIEVGSHEELIAKESGHYKDLYDIQFAETVDS